MAAFPRTENGYFPAQRRALILDILNQQGAVSIQELTSRIDASTATIRRDLAYLSEHHYIERTHGGAVLALPQRTAFEPEAAISSQAALRQKSAIGQLAARALRPGQSVIFDSSSTVLEAAREVARLPIPLAAATNDLQIALVLAECRSVHLVIPGGSLRSDSFTLLGAPGEKFIAGLHFDVALMGIHAVHEGFLSDASIEVAAIKRQMIEASQRVVVLADSSKFAAPAFCNVCGLDQVDELIVDEGVSETARRQLQEWDTTLTIAKL